MARYNTTRRQTPTKPRCGLLKHALLIVIGFACGYTAATFFHWDQVIVWLNTHVFIQTPPPATVAAKKYAEIPKPKFEFYTLLTQENRAAATSGNVASIKEQPTTIAADLPTSSAPSSAPPPQSLPIEMNLTAPQTNIALQEQRAIESTLSQVKAGYWVQLASFRRPQDAEKMKANLSLRGVMTTVVSGRQQNVQWFRVALGPFASKFDAERAKKSVMLSVRIQGIVRKMDA